MDQYMKPVMEMFAGFADVPRDFDAVARFITSAGARFEVGGHAESGPILYEAQVTAVIGHAYGTDEYIATAISYDSPLNCLIKACTNLAQGEPTRFDRRIDQITTLGKDAP